MLSKRVTLSVAVRSDSACARQRLVERGERPDTVKLCFGME
jgi:hypothetical protein